MDIAVLTTQLFDQPGNGGERCTERLLHALLDAGHRVHVAGRGSVPAARPARLHMQTLGPASQAFDNMSWLARTAALAGAWARGQASTVHRLGADGTATQARRWLKSTAAGMDTLVVDHLQVHDWVRRCGARLPTPLLLMHNLESDGYAEQARHAAQAGQRARSFVLAREARLLRALELQALRGARAVACLSECDAVRLRELARQARANVGVVVLPGYAQPALAGPPLPARPAGAQRRIGMLGTWTWGPNREGLLWLLQHVWPRLRSDCELVLAGSLPPALTLPRGVQALGRVDDVGAFYAQVDVVAIPSHSGSGVQEKAIEAVARAPLIVATRHALRGLAPGLPAHVHTADDPDTFALLCAQAVAPPFEQHHAQTQAWATQRRQAYGSALAQCLPKHGAKVVTAALQLQPPAQSQPTCQPTSAAGR